MTERKKRMKERSLDGPGSRDHDSYQGHGSTKGQKMVATSVGSLGCKKQTHCLPEEMEFTQS